MQVIAYIDTSVLLPLVILEPSSKACRTFWDSAENVLSCRLTYVDAAAALASAHRQGRISEASRQEALDRLDRLWKKINVVEIDSALVTVAADFAHDFGLPGPVAVHCASAWQCAEKTLFAGSGDERLLRAWRSLRIKTFDPNHAE